MKKVQTVLCLFVFSVAAFAQTDRGTLTGTVSDPSGAVIPGVAIEAKNIQTGATYQAGSSETGNYTLAQLPAGTYELSATLPGFKKFVREGIIVSVATVLRIDVTLEVGAAGESVTVESASPLLKTESGEVSHNLTTEQVNNLPVLTLSLPSVKRRLWETSGIRCRFSIYCQGRVSLMTISFGLMECLRPRKPSALKARTQPTGGTVSTTKACRPALKRFRKLRSRPVTMRRNLDRPAAATSITR